MSAEELTYYQFKSDLLDLWMNKPSTYAYTEWFNSLKILMNHHFEIDEITLYLFDFTKERYVPVAYFEQSSLENVDENSHSLSSLRKYREVEAFLDLRDAYGSPLAVLFFIPTDTWLRFEESDFYGNWKETMSSYFVSIGKAVQLAEREKKYRRLFNVTEYFNATMDTDIILEGIIETAQHFFPEVKLDILLSHEERMATGNYRLFDYKNERQSVIEAYVSGKLTVERDEREAICLINVPIHGRQGIYGLLKMVATTEFQLSDVQRNLITVLTDTAGNALENASLYNQSHQLIEDLQLVNETSHRLNSHMDLSEMIVYLNQQLCKAFQPTEIAFILLNEKQEIDLLEMSTDFFYTREGKEYIQYAVNEMATAKDTLFEANLSSSLERDVPFESIMSIPFTDQQKVIGYVICAHPTPYYFSFDSFKLMQALIGHSSLALTNLLLRNQLQQLVDRDHLTKLYARRYLDTVVEQSIQKDTGGVLLLFDIDNFKQINDTFGHDVGDNVLRQVATALKDVVGEEGLAARWGGEEFAVYLPHCTRESGQQVAEKALEHIPQVTEPSVTVSIGLTGWIRDEHILYNDLFKFTDAALYSAKHTGKNKVVIHEVVSSRSN